MIDWLTDWLSWSSVTCFYTAGRLFFPFSWISVRCNTVWNKSWGVCVKHSACLSSSWWRLSCPEGFQLCNFLITFVTSSDKTAASVTVQNVCLLTGLIKTRTLCVIIVATDYCNYLYYNLSNTSASADSPRTHLLVFLWRLLNWLTSLSFCAPPAWISKRSGTLEADREPDHNQHLIAL